MGMPDTSDSGVAATSTYTDIGTPSLGNPGSLPASALADSVALDEDTVSFDRSDVPSDGLEGIDPTLTLLPSSSPSCLLDELSRNRVSPKNTAAAPFQDAARDSYFTTTSEMRIGSLFEDPDFLSEWPDERGSKGSQQEGNAPAGLPGTFFEGPARQRGVEDVADDGAATFERLPESWDEELENVALLLE